MTDPCPICNDWRGPKSKKISHKRALRTAHELATSTADKGIAGLEWEEVYSLFFPKIYRHEYKRNLKLEEEIELEESIERNKENPNVCSYHQENIMWADDPDMDCSKRIRQEYAQSKWPNPLKE
jgi:hypothetical protein